MPFAAATKDKVIGYLGYSVNNTSVSSIIDALSAVESLTDSAASSAAIARIEGYLTELDSISTAIDAQRAIEGSTLLPELRREGRRYCQLVANGLGLSNQIDVFGSSGT